MNELIKQLEEEMKIGIDKVISGELKEFKLNNINPAMVKAYLISLRFEAGLFDVNGWECDWVIEFTKNNKLFIACGGGYYGRFSFHVEE